MTREEYEENNLREVQGYPPKENTVREASGSEYRSKGNSADWNTEPNVGRVAHGIPKRVDRLRALGNAVVPQQVYPILEAIAKIHKGEID